ncbi:MAG: ABC transporter ATP-binding protein [Chloroflexi bacterium]|nr:ABC transporter ATP-binding protein [Chloroflexota bacterium]
MAENELEYIAEGKEIVRTYRVDGSEVHALRGANFWTKPGEFIALMGRSGSGKTTLLNIIGGLDQPSSGQIRLFGQDVSRYSDTEATELRRRKIGFVFQSFALMPTMSAFENVELPMRMLSLSRRGRTARVDECLEIVKLSRWAKHRPQELSGGQQQRVAIARALVNKPRLILADEPTGELDSVTGRGIMTLFRSIASEENVTIIMATHDPTIEEYVDYTYRMADGRVLNER